MVRNLNALNMTFGALALIFAGSAMRGGPSIAELTAAVLVFAGGFTARRYFRDDGGQSKRKPLILNILAAVVAGLVAINGLMVAGNVRNSDREIAMILFGIIPLCVAGIALYTAVAIIQDQSGNSGRLPPLG